MTLAQGIKYFSDKQNQPGCACSTKYVKLVEWLEELKDYREQTLNDNLEIINRDTKQD